MWTPILSADQRDQLGIPQGDTAFQVKSINQKMAGGKTPMKPDYEKEMSS